MRLMTSYPIYGDAAGTTTIGSLDDWRTHAPPKKPDIQWQPGRSAMELARRWLAASRDGGMPSEIRSLLTSSDVWSDFTPRRAYAEVKTRIDSLRGEPRNNDLVVVGETKAGAAVLDIEGKADEHFDETIETRLRLAARKPESRIPERAAQLCLALFGARVDDVHHLRYQLLVAVAGALVQAKLHAATHVAFIAHCFETNRTTAENHAKNSADLAAFVAELHKRCASKTERIVDALHGPFEVPGGGDIPAAIPLYVGKATAKV